MLRCGQYFPAVFAGILLFTAVSFAQNQQYQNQPPPREFPKPDTVQIKEMYEKMSKAIEGKQDSPAVKVFQNIQVWKEMPAGRMLGMMRAWTRNLGVDCAHCHNIDQFDKDEKLPKQTARAMDKLVDDVTDQVRKITSIKDEHARVTCWTCHRGEPVPATSFGGFRPPPPPPKKGN
jgi:hypothetical protein